MPPAGSGQVRSSRSRRRSTPTRQLSTPAVSAAASDATDHPTALRRARSRIALSRGHSFLHRARSTLAAFVGVSIDWLARVLPPVGIGRCCRSATADDLSRTLGAGNPRPSETARHGDRRGYMASDEPTSGRAGSLREWAVLDGAKGLFDNLALRADADRRAWDGETIPSSCSSSVPAGPVDSPGGSGCPAFPSSHGCCASTSFRSPAFAQMFDDLDMQGLTRGRNLGDGSRRCRV